MKLEWQQNFETPYETINLQHRYFVDFINRISLILQEDETLECHTRYLEEIIKYADFHFTSEENVAFKYNIPGLDEHHDRHGELLEELKHHAQDLLSRSYSTNDFVNFLVNWFIGHTVYEDGKMFRQLHS